MARPFMFSVLCQRAHPLKHLLAESEKQRKKSSLAGSLVSRGITVHRRLAMIVEASGPLLIKEFPEL